MGLDIITAGEDWTKHFYGGFVDDVGPLLVRVREGHPQFAFRIDKRHLNGNSVVHGGVIMTFLDQSLGMTAWQVHKLYRQATIQLNVAFIEAVRAGELLEARCEVVRRGRSVMFMRGTAHVDGRIVATADGVWKVGPAVAGAAST